MNHYYKLYIIIGLVKGLNDVCKALERKEALLCVLAENCADAKYKKLVTVRCHDPFFSFFHPSFPIEDFL